MDNSRRKVVDPFEYDFQKNGVGVEDLRRRMVNQNLSRQTLDAAAGPTRLTGQFLIKGEGEKRVPVDFPVAFSEKPLLTFGAEVQDGDAIVDGFFPTISVIVSKWFTKENPPFSRFYLGAELAIVTTGVPVQKIIVHWHLDGVAMSNPI